MDECLICKKHYSQDGKCCGGHKNCLMFEEETKGRMIRSTFKLKIASDAETPIIKSGNYITCTEKSGRDYPIRIAKINWVNMDTMIICVEADYHEKEMPRKELIKHFRIVK